MTRLAFKTNVRQLDWNFCVAYIFRISHGVSIGALRCGDLPSSRSTILAKNCLFLIVSALFELTCKFSLIIDCLLASIQQWRAGLSTHLACLPPPTSSLVLTGAQRCSAFGEVPSEILAPLMVAGSLCHSYAQAGLNGGFRTAGIIWASERGGVNRSDKGRVRGTVKNVNECYLRVEIRVNTSCEGTYISVDNYKSSMKFCKRLFSV